MSKVQKMSLNKEGVIQWQDIGDNAFIRFVLENGDIIDCNVNGNGLVVRTPMDRMSVQPRNNNTILVRSE